MRDGLLREEEPGRDVRVAQALRDVREDLELPGGHPGRVRPCLRPRAVPQPAHAALTERPRDPLRGRGRAEGEQLLERAALLVLVGGVGAGKRRLVAAAD